MAGSSGSELGPGPAEGDPVGRVELLTTDRPGIRFHGGCAEVAGLRVRRGQPGSSFRSLHESLINYGGNKAPELLTCCHEESSVGIAHGYANVEGKPMLVMAHSTWGYSTRR